jgi:hypothetical protein
MPKGIIYFIQIADGLHHIAVININDSFIGSSERLIKLIDASFHICQIASNRSNSKLR